MAKLSSAQSDFWDNFGYSARSIEVSQRFELWNDGDESEDQEALDSPYSMRISYLTDQPISPIDEEGWKTWQDLFTDELRSQRRRSHVEAFYGFRSLESGSEITYTIRFGGASNPLTYGSASRTLLIGPQAGLSTEHFFGNISLSGRFGSMIGYSGRKYLSDLSQATPYFLSSRRNSSASDKRVSHDLAYGAELRLSASYWFTEHTRLNATWSNVYLSSIYYPADQFTYNYHNLPPGQLPDNSRDGWLDLLQVAFIVTH